MRSIKPKFLNNLFPRNYVLKSPLTGALVIAVMLFFFVIIYKPFNPNINNTFGYIGTIAVYCIISAVSIFILAKLVQKINRFSKEKKWTIGKEITSMLLILLGLGVIIYFMGFLIEPPADRWNFATFLNSCKYAFLIGLLPIGFFSAINFSYLVSKSVHFHETSFTDPAVVNTQQEKIQIKSKLKKEKLSFFPDQLLYAESDGNYVNFYISHSEGVKKGIIRNSMNNIQEQLSTIPYFIRVHRAYIVNLNKIRSKQGNTSGYKLLIENTTKKIPVSRQNTEVFDKKISHYANI